MHSLKFYFLVVMALVLLILPEPITTILGLALLSWALWRFYGWLGPTNGACRCDACRYGLSRSIMSSHTPGGVSSLSVDASPFTSHQERFRRAQATLPLTRGRDSAPGEYYFRHEKSLKGRW